MTRQRQLPQELDRTGAVVQNVAPFAKAADTLSDSTHLTFCTACANARIAACRGPDRTSADRSAGGSPRTGIRASGSNFRQEEP
ncbi:hypothetical protein J2T57_000201 [Natronocella acetinitrilica]|uniref:Uncharacterized protein n=1 Tax=Natronocella acetinitrilica TaxID=414046 RepID=A0AAE3G188_9GAMM|nr:hypothetical protein [Natronocella acetinitrilica]